VEKASIDEVYVDVTALVDAELRRPPEDASHGAPQAEHSSQDDGEAEAEQEAHGATRGAPVRRSQPGLARPGSVRLAARNDKKQQRRGALTMYRMDHKSIADSVTGDAQVQEHQRLPAAPAGAGSTFSWGSIVEGGPLQDNEFERRLALGANIACRLRGAVREQLGECRKVVSVQTCMRAPCNEQITAGLLVCAMKTRG